MDDIKPSQLTLNQTARKMTSQAEVLRDQQATIIGKQAEIVENQKASAPIRIFTLVLLAGIISGLTISAVRSSCTSTEGLFCQFFGVPEYEQELTDERDAGILQGVEYIFNGGGANSYISGVASVGAQLVVVVSQEADRSFFVETLDVVEDAESIFGITFPVRRGPAEEIFPDSSSSSVLALAQEAFDTGLPVTPSTFTTDMGVIFTTRVVPHGPNTVAIFTIAIDKTP